MGGGDYLTKFLFGSFLFFGRVRLRHPTVMQVHQSGTQLCFPALSIFNSVQDINFKCHFCYQVCVIRFLSGRSRQFFSGFSLTLCCFRKVTTWTMCGESGDEIQLTRQNDESINKTLENHKRPISQMSSKVKAWHYHFIIVYSDSKTFHLLFTKSFTNTETPKLFLFKSKRNN